MKSRNIIVIPFFILTSIFLVGCDKERETTVSLNEVEIVSSTYSDNLKGQLDEANIENSINERIDDILNNMSLEDKIGQMFFVGSVPYTGLIDTYKFGGILLFGNSFTDKTRDQVISDINSMQNASSIPLLIGVDEEGGTVTRVSQNPMLCESRHNSPRYIYNEGGFEAIYNDSIDKSQTLRDLGINVNFAPVCDLAGDPSDFMYYRSFGSDSSQTSLYVENVVDAMNVSKIGSVLKHFPGYGNNTDTHTGIAYDSRAREQFDNEDFKPFIAGIEHNADSILVSHNIVYSIDEQYPASLSKATHDIIRDELEFNGVVMTDDLDMQGVRQFAGDNAIAVLAVKAGNDMLITSSYDVQIPAVIEAVGNGEIEEKQIDDSVRRILRWKIDLGLIEIE